MNLLTRDPKKAGRKAQELANMRRCAVAVFFPANAPNSFLWEDSMPSWWDNEAKWVEHMKRSPLCATIYLPKTI